MSSTNVDEILRRIKAEGPSLRAWLTELERHKELPIYSSMDIRSSGNKLAVVDANLYPSGFNNLCEHGLSDGAAYFKAAIAQEFPEVQRILIFTESHTRNPFYAEHLERIKQMIEAAGFRVALGSWWGKEEAGDVTLSFPGGKKLVVHQISSENGKITAGEFTPELMILNNDLALGVPEPLEGIRIPVIPALEGGWHIRLKSRHFEICQRLLNEFAHIIGIDPWLVSCFFSIIGHVDFFAGEGTEETADAVSDLLKRILVKYREHGIHEEPYVFLKSDTGTYGMASLPLDSRQEIVALNRRQKNKIHAGKGGRRTHRFLLQEGIPTSYRLEGMPCEVCVYQIHNQFIGGFYRSHPSKDERDNLNSKGMNFTKMCPHRNEFNSPGCGCYADCSIFDLYRILGRISGIAAGLELSEHRIKVVS